MALWSDKSLNFRFFLELFFKSLWITQLIDNKRYFLLKFKFLANKINNTFHKLGFTVYKNDFIFSILEFLVNKIKYDLFDIQEPRAHR